MLEFFENLGPVGQALIGGSLPGYVRYWVRLSSSL